MIRHGKAQFEGLNYFCNLAHDQDVIAGRFGRMFPGLNGLYTDPRVLAELGAVDGPMDGGRDPDRSDTIDVGMVFFAQFLDHDITLDTSSSLSRVNTPSDIENIRTPTLDLDCIYGDGPEGSPYLYAARKRFRSSRRTDPLDESLIYLVTSEDGTAISRPNNRDIRSNDLSRAANGRALIGDPRNDENRVLSQIQLAFHKLHNRVVDKLRREHPDHDAHEIFEEARHLVTAHYHWAVLYDFLPTICGSQVVHDILHYGRKAYCVGSFLPFIPVEFSVAAFRFGHTLVPQTVQIQRGEPARALFGDLFGKGFTALENVEGIVDLDEIFTTARNRQVQRAEKMNTKFARTLLKLPAGIASNPSSLAVRNLERGQSFMLPSGEAVSRALGIEDTVIDSVSQAADTASGGKLDGCTPLFFYMLIEAETIGRQDIDEAAKPGEGLGPMGARLVAEVIIGLMELDPRSFLSTNRKWSPADGLGEDVRTVGEMLTYDL